MNRQQVESSMFDSVGYDSGREVLEVQFHNGIYQYLDVPKEVYEDFVNAPSLGRYFLDCIRDDYTTVRVR